MCCAFQISETRGLEDVCGIWKYIGEEINQMPELRIENVFKSHILGKTKLY